MSRLRVEDALNYLDLVKNRFAGQDDVISRVRDLFHDHPDLIVRFNSFIPQGYKIDYPAAMSTNNRNSFNEDMIPSRQVDETEPALKASGADNLAVISNNIENVQRSAYSSRTLTEHTPESQTNQAQSFHHAFQYVNKVKNRFQGSAEVYRRFLDILHWYQNEQRQNDPAKRRKAESFVYTEVAQLFDGQEDLLQEFNQFLPESTVVACGEADLLPKRLPAMQSVNSLTRVASESLNVVQTPVRQNDVVSNNRFHRSGASTSEQDSAIKSSQSSQQMSHGESPKKTNRMMTMNTPQTPLDQGKKGRNNARDVSLMDVHQVGNLSDMNVLQKVQSALSNNKRAYTAFLQNVNLFNKNTITADQLLNSVRDVLGPHPEVWKMLKDLVVGNSTASRSSHCDENVDHKSKAHAAMSAMENKYSSLNNSFPGSSSMGLLSSTQHQRRLDLDFSKLRTSGRSYRALPPDFTRPKCSGRLKCQIAQKVLNDEYVSFSSLTSEDTQFVSSKKNQYEENMYRVEDERYEVDMVIELNRCALSNLLAIKKKMDKMSREDVMKYRIDEYLGGTSSILMNKAIHRVYGEKASDVIYGLKKCPRQVLNIVITRMRQKDEEWREEVKKFQRAWTEQDSRNYLRSLDHQGPVFKSKDAASIRCKNFINQIEIIAGDDKSTSMSSPGMNDPIASLIANSLDHSQSTSSIAPQDCLASWNTSHMSFVHVHEGTGRGGGAHLTLRCPPLDQLTDLMSDAASLVIHHVKRQPNTSKEDKREMKLLIRTCVQDLFQSERLPMSDDEEEDDDEEDEDGEATRRVKLGRSNPLVEDETKESAEWESGRSPPKRQKMDCTSQDAELNKSSSDGSQNKSKPVVKEEPYPTESDILAYEAECRKRLNNEESYTVFYANNHWYAFLRLYHLLVCRLHLLKARGELQAKEFHRDQPSRMRAAEVLRLRRATNIEPHKYYKKALTCVKELLDGCEDSGTYEDRLRDMFGVYAYSWFTMDKLVGAIVKQLHSVACTDELSQRMTKIFRHYHQQSFPTAPQHVSDPHNQLSGGTNSGSVSGPLRTRLNRLSVEASYACQVFDVCTEHAAAQQSSNGVSAASNSVANNQNNSQNIPGGNMGTASAANPTQAGLIGNQTDFSNHPNCFAIVILKQSSLLLIRLLEPAVSCTNITSSAMLLHPGNSTTASSMLRMHHLAEKQTLQSLDHSIEEPSRVSSHWFDYISRYLYHFSHYGKNEAITLGARIRPVFLFRTIRRCIQALTQSALRRRKQELLDTGCVQPEEVLMAELEKDQVEVAEEAQCSNQYESDSKSNFQKEVWSLMFTTFRNALTRRELFEDTYASDFMQSNAVSNSCKRQLVNVANGRSINVQGLIVSTNISKSYKITWNVGSYGVFYRKKSHPRPRVKATGHSPTKFHEFRKQWLDRNLTEEEDKIWKQMFRCEPKQESVTPASNPVDYQPSMPLTEDMMTTQKVLDISGALQDAEEMSGPLLDSNDVKS